MNIPAGKYQVPEPLSVTARFVVHRLNENRDLKVIVTGKGATTGISKTTGAIQFADFVHSIQECDRCGNFTYPSVDRCHRCGSPDIHSQQDRWDPEASGFFNPWEYMNYYSHNSSVGEVLLLDEAEYSIHKRRAMSGENVEMTKIWAALRYRNCISILTLPSTSMIDSQMMQLGDLWFNATRKGTFDLYHYFYNDFTQQVTPHPLVNEHGMQERFEFQDLEGDPRKSYIDDQKEQFTGDGMEVYDAEDMESELKDATMQHKVAVCEKILANTELSQGEVADCIPAPDSEESDTMSQPWVSKVNRGKDALQDESDNRYPIRG